MDIRARFGGVFLLSTVFLTGLLFLPRGATHLHHLLSRRVAALSAWILSMLGDASASATDLDFNGFGVSIDASCDGVLPACIYLSAVLALPSRWGDKGWGALIGIPTIFAINQVRVITLMLTGAISPRLFERVHIDVWQSLVILVTLAVWVYWVEAFVRPRSQKRP